MRLFPILAAAGLLGVLRAPAAAETYAIDPAHSSITFAVGLAGRPIPGSFSQFQGTITVEAARPGKITAIATVSTGSLSTKNERRDRHLMSPDYFNVAQFPTMAFQGEGIAPAGEGDFDLTGNLTIKRTTQKVAFHVHPAGGGASPRWEASAKVNRKDFGVSHDALSDLAIGNTVEIHLTIQTSPPPRRVP